MKLRSTSDGLTPAALTYCRNQSGPPRRGNVPHNLKGLKAQDKGWVRPGAASGHSVMPTVAINYGSDQGHLRLRRTQHPATPASSYAIRKAATSGAGSDIYLVLSPVYRLTYPLWTAAARRRDGTLCPGSADHCLLDTSLFCTERAKRVGFLTQKKFYFFISFFLKEGDNLLLYLARLHRSRAFAKN